MNLKNKKGITLIALIITIIVLLILAGVSIAMLAGENGILNRAVKAKNKTIEGEERDIISLAYSESAMDDEEYKVSTEKLEEKLKNYKPNVSVSDGEEGDMIVTFEDTKNSYSVDGNGKIKTAEIHTPEPTPEKGTITFSREFGVVEVEWLEGTTYNTSNVANEPKMTDDMKAVYWDESGKEIVKGEDSSFVESKWYNYEEQNGSTENIKTGTSHWANAKTSDGSYWVWIPRYAFRIVYFDTKEHRDKYRENKSNTDGIIGYCDARGITATDGKAVPNISDSSTAVAVNDDKMRAHPAFEKEIDKGGWDSRLSGIWVAKFEMSQETSSDKGQNWDFRATTGSSTGNILTSNAKKGTTGEEDTSNLWVRTVSKPSYESNDISSWRYINVGNMYNNGMYYDRVKESHLMKNSEWGAVAYLTDSKYGRNGTEVTINNNSSYYTGMAGETVSASSSSTTNYYNTDKGQLASTTGNIYGVYDMSGGAREYVAAFNSLGNESTINSYGSSFAKKGGTSTKYATEYRNDQSDYKENFTIGFLSTIGDGMQDIFKSGTSGWNGDYVDFVSSSYPFLTRGGNYNNGTRAGVFYSSSYSGAMRNSTSYYGFRVVLVP